MRTVHGCWKWAHTITSDRPRTTFLTCGSLFFRIIDEVRRIVDEKGWKLEGKMNQGYFTFKYEFFGVFGILFTTSKTVCLFFKVPQSVVDTSRSPVPLFRYRVEWKQALYKADTLDFDVRKLLPVFEAAYRNIVGE